MAEKKSFGPCDADSNLGQRVSLREEVNLQRHRQNHLPEIK